MFIETLLSERFPYCHRTLMVHKCLCIHTIVLHQQFENVAVFMSITVEPLHYEELNKDTVKMFHTLLLWYVMVCAVSAKK